LRKFLFYVKIKRINKNKMLHYQLKSYFENPARRMYEEAAPRWTDLVSGKSTDYAKEYQKNIETERSKLAADVAGAIPERDKLQKEAVTAKKGDTITGILLKLTDAKLSNPKLMLLSYRYMLKQCEDLNNEFDQKGRKFDINFLAPGDTIAVENGQLVVTRAPGSSFKNLKIDIFPYLEPVPTEPEPAPTPTPDQGGTAPGGAPAPAPKPAPAPAPAPKPAPAPAPAPKPAPAPAPKPAPAPNPGGTAPGGAPSVPTTPTPAPKPAEPTERGDKSGPSVAPTEPKERGDKGGANSSQVEPPERGSSSSGGSNGGEPPERGEK
jgi:hypothetical protein